MVSRSTSSRRRSPKAPTRRSPSYLARSKRRSTARWTLIAPVLYLLVVLGNLALTEWSRVPVGFVLSALALVLGVVAGFAEELVCRGVLLVGLRGKLGEVWAWLISCLLFGVMHRINIVLGQAVGSRALPCNTAETLCILRRMTGSLVPAMRGDSANRRRSRGRLMDTRRGLLAEYGGDLAR